MFFLKKKKGKYNHVIKMLRRRHQNSRSFQSLLQSSNNGQRIHLWTVSPGAPSRATTAWAYYTAPSLGQFTTGMHHSGNGCPPQFCITATKQQLRWGNPSSKLSICTVRPVPREPGTPEAQQPLPPVLAVPVHGDPTTSRLHQAERLLPAPKPSADTTARVPA